MMRLGTSFGALWRGGARRERRNTEIRHFSDHMKNDIGWYNGPRTSPDERGRAVVRDVVLRFNR